MIQLSLQPSPASETSAFNRMRAFNSRFDGLFPLRISACKCSRSSALNCTTYFFTEMCPFPPCSPPSPNRDRSGEKDTIS